MRSLQLKVGALIAGALVLLAGFLVALGGLSWTGGVPLRLDFDFSGNLQPGAPVKVSGIKVGRVAEVRYLGGAVDPESGRRVQVRVVARVEERVRESIRANAEFFINTQGVLGEQYLEIQPGSWERPPLDLGPPLRGTSPPRTDLIVARLYELLDDLTAILRDDKDAIRDFLRSGASLVRTLDHVLQANRAEVGHLLTDVDALAQKASALLTSLRAGVGDGAELRATLGNVAALTAAVRRDVEPLLQKLGRALDGVDRLTGAIGPNEQRDIKRALAALGSLAERADHISADAAALVAGLKQGKGTAGALLVDPQIYEDLKEMVRDLRRNPWKFFWKE